MAEDKDKEQKRADSKDQVALELMKFVAETTGYGKGAPICRVRRKASEVASKSYAGRAPPAVRAL